MTTDCNEVHPKKALYFISFTEVGITTLTKPSQFLNASSPMDACTEENGLTNESGAGWTVATQDDRGLFYENYALQLLECKGCVGFDWFQFLDNDPEDTNADLSNTNANKGIISNTGEEYTDLTAHMSILNNKKYELINFFDTRNAQN